MKPDESKLDRVDRGILEALQENAELSIADVAEKVGLSPTPCWRRIQKLEERGVIRKRVALLEPRQVNLGLTVFISVRTNHHKIEWFESFYQLVNAMPEVVEFYRVTGNTDYLIKVMVSSIEGYDKVYKTLIKGAELADVSSMFAMEQIKYTTALPLDQAI